MSRFTRHLRALLQPRICRRPPIPLPPVPPPVSELHLFAYAAWIEPGSPGEANAVGAFTLWPDPATNTWHGTSEQGDPQLRLELELEPEPRTANVDLFLFRAGVPVDQYFFTDLPVTGEPWVHIELTRRELPLGRGHVEVEIGTAPPIRRLQQGRPAGYNP